MNTNRRRSTIILLALLFLLVPSLAKARMYNENSGRFLTFDTDEGDTEDPQSLHKYLFGADNPVDNVDPSGNDTLDAMIMPVFASIMDISISPQGVVSYGGIDVDVYVWKWKRLGVVLPGHSVGHVMVIDNGTKNVEVSQFPEKPGQPSKPKGPNNTYTYDQTFTAEDERNPDTKFLVHLPDSSPFHTAVNHETKCTWWDWWPKGPDQTQCARAAYDVLKAGGLPLWGYDHGGEILPGWLSVKLNQFANSSSQPGRYSVKRIN